MPQQTKFFQPDITETDHGAVLEQDGNRIELGCEAQVTATKGTLDLIAKKLRAKWGKQTLEELGRELKGGKKASLTPIKGDGPKGAA